MCAPMGVPAYVTAHHRSIPPSNGECTVLWLRLIHIVFGTFWTGSAIFTAFFLLPVLRSAGPAAGPVMSRLGPRIGPILGVASLLTIISGFIMFGQLSAGTGGEWVHTPRGTTLGVGGRNALGARFAAICLIVAVGAMAIARYV